MVASVPDATNRMLSMHGETAAMRSAGCRVSDTQAEHGRLGSRRHEPDALDARGDGGDALGELYRPAVDRGEVGAERGLTDCGFDHLRMRVTDERSAPGHRHVEKLPTVGVPHPAAFATLDDG